MCEELLSKLRRVVSFCHGRYILLFLSCIDLRVNFFLMQILGWEYRPNLECLQSLDQVVQGQGLIHQLKSM